MMSGKLDFRQTKAASEPRKAALRSASKEPKPEASAQAAPQASGNAGGLGEHELEALRQFDLTGRYGPCTGITRLQRWERAHKLGLHPPPQVKALLEQQAPGSAHLENLWSGRV